MSYDAIVDRVTSDGYPQYRLQMERDHWFPEWIITGWARMEGGLPVTVNGRMSNEGLELTYS